jgi:hypothetical protein
MSALERRDAAALRQLALSEEEFRDHVWPELPAARPERGLPLSYAWRDLHQKSEAGLARTLAEWGGRWREVIDIEFTGGTTRYQTFAVHREAVVRLLEADGTTAEARLFGSVLEKDGRVKVFSYVVD